MPHIGVEPIPQATWRRPYGQTQNTTDTIAVPYGYTVGYLRVEIEGRALNPDEYTADDGMVVTFPQSLPAGTNWAFEIITPFQAADHYTKGEVYTQSEIDAQNAARTAEVDRGRVHGLVGSTGGLGTSWKELFRIKKVTGSFNRSSRFRVELFSIENSSGQPYILYGTFYDRSLDPPNYYSDLRAFAYYSPVSTMHTGSATFEARLIEDGNGDYVVQGRSTTYTVTAQVFSAHLMGSAVEGDTFIWNGDFS